LTKKRLYNYLTSIKVGIISFLILFSYSVQAQLLDSIAIDTIRSYSLQSALKEDPLKVYKLVIKKKKLTEIPQEIYQFKNLNILDLSKNKIKEFPIELGQLQYLQKLILSSNKITNIPKELGLLRHLKELYLNQNKVTALPPEIKNLKKLKIIDLWGNDIGFLPYEISELKNTLEEIDMRVILMSSKEHKKIKSLLPNTKIKFSKSCNCAF
jgi:Leucine-rich repeat (LRR) protein